MNIYLKNIFGYHEDKYGLITLVAEDGNGNPVNIKAYRPNLEDCVREAKLVAESRKRKTDGII